MSIATSLKMLRKDAGLTQRELAQKVGLPLRSIINYENGLREPNSKAMATLERFFNVSGEYLRGETDQRDLMNWDDSDIMDAVRESLPKQLRDLNEILKKCSSEEQKLTFDILVQLHLVLLLKDDSKRHTALSMIHEVAAAVEHLTGDQPKGDA